MLLLTLVEKSGVQLIRNINGAYIAKHYRAGTKTGHIVGNRFPPVRKFFCSCLMRRHRDIIEYEADFTVVDNAPSARWRPSPYFEVTPAEGVTASTTYNQMLMPTNFGQLEGEYWYIIYNVCQ